MTDLERLALAVLLFHRGGAWSTDDHKNWLELTGTPLATSRNLCNLARKLIGNGPSPETNLAGPLQNPSPILESSSGPQTNPSDYSTPLYHHSSSPRPIG